MAENKDTILVLGVGNTLLSDEAVGVRIGEALDARLQSEPDAHTLGIVVKDGGTMGLTLLVELEDAGAFIVLDAAQLNAAPGTVRTFEGDAMDTFLRQRGRSPHDIGLDDLMDGLRLRGAVPERRALVAVQPESLGVGERLSPAVAEALDPAVTEVLRIARAWRKNEGRG